MADVRTARRNAEKAARDALAGTLVGAAGELGVARATQQEATADVDAAAEKGRQLVEAARLEGGRAARSRAGRGRRGGHRLRQRVAGRPGRRVDAGAAAWHGLCRSAGLRSGPASHRHAGPSGRRRALGCGGFLTAPPYAGGGRVLGSPRALAATPSPSAPCAPQCACRYRCWLDGCCAGALGPTCSGNSAQ
jgi:hypothetical protein